MVAYYSSVLNADYLAPNIWGKSLWSRAAPIPAIPNWWASAGEVEGYPSLNSSLLKISPSAERALYGATSVSYFAATSERCLIFGLIKSGPSPDASSWLI